MSVHEKVGRIAEGNGGTCHLKNKAYTYIQRTTNKLNIFWRGPLIFSDVCVQNNVTFYLTFVDHIE